MEGAIIKAGKQVRFKFKGEVLVTITAREDLTILPGKMLLEDGMPYYIHTVIQDLKGNIDALCEEYNHFCVMYSEGGPILVANNYTE